MNMKATMKVMTINQRGIIFDLAHRVATELTYKPSIADSLAQGERVEFGVFVPFLSKNIGHIPAETPKQAIRLRSNRKNYRFLRRARS